MVLSYFWTGLSPGAVAQMRYRTVPVPNVAQLSAEKSKHVHVRGQRLRDNHNDNFIVSSASRF